MAVKEIMRLWKFAENNSIRSNLSMLMTNLFKKGRTTPIEGIIGSFL